MGRDIVHEIAVPAMPPVRSLALQSSRPFAGRAAKGGRTVLGWSGEAGAPAPRPRPNLAALGLAIDGPTPLPGEYQPGTPGFRYWAIADALARALAPWSIVLGAAPAWADGSILLVRFEGAGRRQVYTRATLDLPAATPLAACHGIGLALLDALRPELWDVTAQDADTLHRAFAEATARMAGFAPAAAPGFAAVFAGLLAMLTAKHGMNGTPAAARLLVTAAHRVPVAPDLMGQFAIELALATAVQEGPDLAARLRGLLAAQGLLSPSPVLDRFDPHEAEDGTEIPARFLPLPWVAVAARGRKLPLLLLPASHPPRLFLPAPERTPAPLADACRHAQNLLASHLAEEPRVGRTQRSAPGTNRWATHLLVDDGRTLRLVRQRMLLG